jgi:peroxiredoxin
MSRAVVVIDEAGRVVYRTSARDRPRANYDAALAKL